jgi:hypothetical protein
MMGPARFLLGNHTGNRGRYLFIRRRSMMDRAVSLFYRLYRLWRLLWRG